MKKILTASLATAIAAVMMAPATAMAGSADGKLQIKVLGTGVLPDGKIVEANANTATTLGAAVAGTVGTQTKANDNYVPTIAIEYFFNPMFSVETICCLTQHHVDGAGGLPSSARLVDHVLILPATVTLKAHLDAGPVKPYVGVGPSWFHIMGEKPGAFAKGANITGVKLSDEFGVALQAGVDIPVNDQGMGLSIDAKKYFIDTTATFYEGSTVALKSKHSLDPWVVSAGISYRF